MSIGANLQDVESALANAILELERDYGSNAQEDFVTSKLRALQELYGAQEMLREIIESGGE